MAAIQLSNRGLVALVDDEDYERVAAHKWIAIRSGGCGFYARKSLKQIPAQHQLLHRFILRTAHDERVDHINGDGLDNRRCNLRIVTPAQNAKNCAKPRIHGGASSQFKGVCRVADSDRWRANIASDRVKYRLGTFASEEEAARAYDEAATRLHGEFARTNKDLGLLA